MGPGGDSAPRTAIVCAGGEPIAPRVFAALDLREPTLVVAADSGVHLAEQLGLTVDLVVGDLDSADPAAVERAAQKGARVSRHPAAKDETDLELALREASLAGCDNAVVLGIGGGRIDHFLANVLLLAGAPAASMTVRAIADEGLITVVRDSARLHGRVGDLVTLLAVGGPAEGVRTEGLEFPLVGERLEAGSSRGVSNVLESEIATVSLDRGVLLAVQPREA